MSPTPLRRVLVANRGEIARRVIRAARAVGMSTVAVHSDVDADAPYVTDADLAVRLPGAAAAQTYLDVGAIIGAARRTGADAVHPGYGFLAENADAAQAVLDAGLTWVGPRPDAMRAMASKLAAKEIVASAGVPTLPSARLDGDDEQLQRKAADEVGYPLLVKASAGGGGRGMRIVEDAAGLPDAVRAARREAEAAFGDGTVYCERFVRHGRHVEVQVLADHHGTVLHAFERECSLQRRHQKVLEESPSPGTPPDVRARMYAAAVATARAVDYTSLGTVEFLLEQTHGFYFLEMNTRLQVEHPVTEMITGLDLVALQLRIAAGHRLGLTQDDITRDGHAVEVRLVAEDPARGWTPSSGTLTRFDPPGPGVVPGVRWETGVESGSVVPAHYDSLLGKVIAHAESRDEALDRLRAALAGLRVHGVATNRDALLALVDDPDVRAGRTTIDLLEARGSSLVTPLSEDDLDRHAVAAAFAAAAERAQRSASGSLALPGWRSMADAVDVTTLHGPASRTVTIRTTQRGRHVASVGDGEPAEVVVHGWDGEWLDVEANGIRRRAAVLRRPGWDGTDARTERDGLDHSYDVFLDGRASEWTEPARLPAGDRTEGARGPSSPVPGTIVAVHVRAGDTVGAGDPLVVLEAMKMEHRITADTDASVVEVVVAVGDSVDAHEVLVVLEPLGTDEPLPAEA